MGTAERVKCLHDLSPAVYKPLNYMETKKGRRPDFQESSALLFMTIECSQSVHSIVFLFLRLQLLFPAFFR